MAVVLPAIVVLTLSANACNYPFAVRRQETVCAGGLDEDGDGLTDCQDPDCSETFECAAEYVCDDNQDNDADGNTDCDDADCSDDAACQPTEICDNAQDDDGDGQTDCADLDCQDDAACQVELSCANQIDDDQDGATDCDDADCADALPCLGSQPCNENGICEMLEDRLWCADCCPDCSLSEGSNNDFIVYRLIAPTNAAEAEQIGVDLDGDGTIDNALGALVAQFSTDPESDINHDLQEAIDDGEFIMLVRMVVSSWPDDDALALQVFAGDNTLDATEDNLSGSGHTLISLQADRSIFLCSDMVGGEIESCGGPLELPFYLLNRVVTLPMERGQILSTQPLSPDGWQSVMIGGGMNQQTIDNAFLPTLQVYLNQETKQDPDSTIGQFALTFIDEQCSDSLAGCEAVINGTGECSAWTGDASDQPLTLTELQCNALLRGYLELDVDSDGDGTADLLSFGVQVDATPITIDN
jgi:hypothetical protein